MPSSTELCGGMAHQGLKQHIGLSISRLSTYKALRDENINYSRARRTWIDPNAMQVDAKHVNVNQERQADGSGSRSDKGKGSKGGKGKSKKGCKGKERGEKAATKFDGECRYCLKMGTQKVRQAKWGQCTLSDTRNAAFSASELCTRAWQAPSRCNRWCQCTSRVPDGSQTS